MLDRLGGVGIGKPDAVAQAESGMAVQGEAEGAGEKLVFDDAAKRLALGLHRCAGETAEPGQAGADALPSDQEGDRVRGIERGVAHQVDALGLVRVPSHMPPGFTRGMKITTNGVQLSMQHAVPVQTHHQAVQKNDQDFSADPFEAMHAAKKSDCRNLRILTS